MEGYVRACTEIIERYDPKHVSCSAQQLYPIVTISCRYPANYVHFALISCQVLVPNCGVRKYLNSLTADKLINSNIMETFRRTQFNSQAVSMYSEMLAQQIQCSQLIDQIVHENNYLQQEYLAALTYENLLAVQQSKNPKEKISAFLICLEILVKIVQKYDTYKSTS